MIFASKNYVFRPRVKSDLFRYLKQKVPTSPSRWITARTASLCYQHYPRVAYTTVTRDGIHFKTPVYHSDLREEEAEGVGADVISIFYNGAPPPLAVCRITYRDVAIMINDDDEEEDSFERHTYVFGYNIVLRSVPKSSR